jgi:hypothetical protein
MIDREKARRAVVLSGAFFKEKISKKMNYKVIPYKPAITNKGSLGDVAKDIEDIIQKGEKAGWEFIQLQEVTTFVAGSNGCFGIGATPGYNNSITVLIFNKTNDGENTSSQHDSDLQADA